MDTVFVSFDYENDKKYKYLLEAWHKNPKFNFTFEDGTPTEINSENVGRVKAALTTKVKTANTTLVLIGKHVNERHRHSTLIGFKNWINFEIARSIENGNRLAIVMLERGNELPDELRGAEYSIAYSFTEESVMAALRDAPYQLRRYG